MLDFHHIGLWDNSYAVIAPYQCMHSIHRDTIHGWGKEARRKRKRLGIYGDDSTFDTDTRTMVSAVFIKITLLLFENLL
ncbi:hypothetical protein Hanom_Chr00s202467g01838371 [Helianthus anomalus]